MASYDRRSFRYASCYCEENVWHLAADPRIQGDGRFVVFISNADRTCPVWAQRSSPEPDLPALWDYHVVFVVHRTGGALVYDLDTRLAFPCPMDQYIAESFPLADRMEPRFNPTFRVIEASEFASTFASDRSHMMLNGRWRSPPPAWPPIRTEHATMNLDRFIDMVGSFVGEVLDLERLLARFTAK